MVDANLLLSLIDGLDDALIWMIEKFNPEKNWGSVRESAYVLDLLIQYGFSFQSSFLSDAVNWLLNERRGPNWMEEIWETAVALKALFKVKDMDISGVIKDAEDWLKHKQDSRDGLWNDELWESSFVLWYFLEAGTDDRLDLIQRPMRWLTSKQSKEDGSVVVPHYTAFYLILHSYLKINNFEAGKKHAIKWFMENYSPTLLWSEVCYSNGYAIYGLLRNGVKFSESMKESLINQVLEVQDEENSWGEENIEDTYAYLLALRELLYQEIKTILSKKKLEELEWDILDRGFLQYFQYLDKLNVKKDVYDGLIKRQLIRINSLVSEDKKLHAFLLFCLLINKHIYEKNKNEVDKIIETLLGFAGEMIKNAEYELFYHFLQTLNNLGIKNKNNKLVNDVYKIAEKVIFNLIKVDRENWLNNYIETASNSVIHLSEAEGKLDLAFKLLNILIDSNNFGQTIKIFDKIEEIIMNNRNLIEELKIKEFIKLILTVSTNLYISQQIKLADGLYQKIPNLINNILNYKDLDVLYLLREAWFIESLIGYSHPENFWANLLCNAISDQDVHFSEILLKIFMGMTKNAYNVGNSILKAIEKKPRDRVIDASRIEFTLHKMENQYKVSLRLTQKGKIQAPIRVVDSFYIDQNAREQIILHIFDVIHYFPYSGQDKESCRLLIGDQDFLGWKVEAFGAPPDTLDILGCNAEDFGSDLLYFLGRTLFLLLPASIRNVFLYLKKDPKESIFLQLQIDDFEIPWDFFHTGENFVINELATGNIVMEPTAYKLIKPIEFGKDKINVLIIGNPIGDLENSSIEAEIILKALKDIYIVDEVKIILGDEASKENVLECFKSGKYQLIHYAGHTFFNEKVPAKSGLVLKDEEILTGHELEEALKIANDVGSYHPLIYLNSCDASKIKAVESKEGVLKFDGVAISLIRGGALGCVGNNWEVEDEAIKELSINFYRLLLEGTPVGEALMKSRKQIYAKRMKTYCYEDTEKKIVYENRSWGSPKLFGEVQISLVQKAE